VKKDYKILNNIDEILMSLDGINRASATPFLLKKVIGTINSQENSQFKTSNIFISSPIVVYTFIGLVFVFDMLILKPEIVKTNSTPDKLNYRIMNANETDEELYFSTSENNFLLSL
jgi:hypothetical protein